MFSRVIKMYNETEVREIQDVISGARQLSDAEREAVIRQFNGTSIKRYLKPFVPLFATNPDLYAKVSVDERAINYSFLDETTKKFLDDGEFIFISRIIDGDTVESENESRILVVYKSQYTVFQF